MSTPTRRPSRLAAPQPAPDWTRAACRNTNDDSFFPIGDSAPARAQAEQAKHICGRCPIRLRCLSWALETQQDQGVWGGLTEKERLALHKRRTDTEWGRARGVAEDIFHNRLEEFMDARARGLEGTALAAVLGTNVQTVNRVLELVEASARAAVEEVNAA